MQRVESKRNPLKDILSAIPDHETPLHVSLMRVVASLLLQGGIQCDSLLEVMEVLEILHDMEVIELKKVTPKQSDTKFTIRKIINGG